MFKRVNSHLLLTEIKKLQIKNSDMKRGVGGGNLAQIIPGS